MLTLSMVYVVLVLIINVFVDLEERGIVPGKPKSKKQAMVKYTIALILNILALCAMTYVVMQLVPE